MNLQEFLLSELVDGARTRTPAEVVEEVQQQLARSGGQGFSQESSAPFIRKARDE